MFHEIVTTKDGSHTLLHKQLGEHYHSLHGAVQESEHVYIEAGLSLFQEGKSSVSVLEIGFGTGLNAWLTYLWSKVHAVHIHYTTLEPHPLPFSVVEKLNYHKSASDKEMQMYLDLHHCGWGQEHQLEDFFVFQKLEASVDSISAKERYDLIYFDAFAPKYQPEMWEKSVFELLFQSLKTEGFLVTYCANGKAKRAMQAAGFTVVPCVGPVGKREMTKAIKIV